MSSYIEFKDVSFHYGEDDESSIGEFIADEASPEPDEIVGETMLHEAHYHLLKLLFSLTKNQN